MSPVLAGRNREALAALGQELQVAHRVFTLDDPAAVEAGIHGVTVVLNCAGPFRHTWRPIADACLRTRAHYLDITGEIAVFEALAARDAQAKAAGVLLLPGVGFDIVPSDCLAAHLKQRLPSATHLALGIQSLSRTSRGTALTIAENMHHGGLIRRNGVLKQVPAAWKTRVISFGAGPVKAITIPWGDVASAYYSTRIPNIEVYMAAPLALRVAMRASRFLGWALASSFVQEFVKKRIRAGPPGPTAEERARRKSYLWGEVTDSAGNKAEARLQGPEAYSFTVRTALAVVERVLAGQTPVGFHTPSMAFGPDFVLHVEGTVRADA